MVDADMSPLLRDLCAKVAPIEARIAILDAEIAAREQERDSLRSTLAGISRALDPEQVALPLPGLGSAGPAEKPIREPSRMAEELLCSRVPAIGPDASGWTVTIPRDSIHRGELKCAHSLAHGDRPLFIEESRTKSAVVYRLTPDGEAVTRALPPRVAP